MVTCLLTGMGKGRALKQLPPPPPAPLGSPLNQWAVLLQCLYSASCPKSHKRERQEKNQLVHPSLDFLHCRCHTSLTEQIIAMALSCLKMVPPWFWRVTSLSASSWDYKGFGSKAGEIECSVTCKRCKVARRKMHCGEAANQLFVARSGAIQINKL